jgi:hypothetical protein
VSPALPVNLRVNPAQYNSPRFHPNRSTRTPADEVRIDLLAADSHDRRGRRAGPITDMLVSTGAKISRLTIDTARQLGFGPARLSQCPLWLFYDGETECYARILGLRVLLGQTPDVIPALAVVNATHPTVLERHPAWATDILGMRRVLDRFLLCFVREGLIAFRRV